MTTQGSTEPDRTRVAAQYRGIEKFEKSAPLDPTDALEEMLISAHRVAVTLGELSVFQNRGATVAEWGILKSLGDRQDVPLREINAAVAISRQRFRKLVSELQAKGLISTSRALAEDKRMRTISATPLAAKTLSMISLQMQDLLQKADKDTGRRNHGRGFINAARSMNRVTKAMRRKWLKKSGKGTNADGEARKGDEN